MKRKELESVTMEPYYYFLSFAAKEGREMGQ